MSIRNFHSSSKGDTLLPLIDVTGTNSRLQDDFTVACLSPCDKKRIACVLVIMSETECSPLVDPSCVDEFVHLQPQVNTTRTRDKVGIYIYADLGIDRINSTRQVARRRRRKDRP